VPEVIAGGVLLGLAAASAGAAVGLGVAALSRRDAYADSGFTDSGTRDDAATLVLATNVTWGAAGAALIGGVVLLAVGLSRGQDVAARDGSVIVGHF
jgi:hypothetical protein